MEGFNSVDDLKPFKTMWRVKVSIVRLWKRYSAAGGLTIEIVFIDSNGDKIHVSVKKELVNQFEHKLEQGKILTFTNFSLNHSVGSYRMTNHLYKISVLATTRVRSCEALPVGLNGFTPVNFQEVLDGSLNPDFLIDKIHASVKKELVNQFEHQLEEGKTLTFTIFSLNHSIGSYRTTNHLYKISVLATTRVRSCEALPVGLNGFTPVNFQENLDGSLNPDFLIDVIKHVVKISHVEMISVNGKETQKISLELRDLADVRLPMVLWGNFATDVTNAIQLRGEGRVILVLRFGKIKVWKEDRYAP
ncbi:hypothetical protein F2Q69_00011731 [Brassica cretica]|uniref:Replication protein A 70 kDa DNA-binding subunit B/D first OB fold domain-containing protein n=1 Tax=Brassica cretica TaxID=69181 RepID=A0A8S9QTR9_BRACR|nr:hypothetical protein F2Q69_00011731 [Brassica cretica]